MRRAPRVHVGGAGVESQTGGVKVRGDGSSVPIRYEAEPERHARRHRPDTVPGHRSGGAAGDGQVSQFVNPEITERSPTAAVTWTHTPGAWISTGCVEVPDDWMSVTGVPPSVRIPTSR